MSPMKRNMVYITIVVVILLFAYTIYKQLNLDVSAQFIWQVLLASPLAYVIGVIAAMIEETL